MPTSPTQLRLRLAAHLRKAMSDRGWNRSDLSRALGVAATGGAVYRIIAGKRTMGLDLFALLHTKLGLDANKLLDEDPPAKYFDRSLPGDLAREVESIAKELPPDAARVLERAAARLREK